MLTFKKLTMEIGVGLCILLSVGFLCTLVGSEPISLHSIRESPQNAQIFFEVRIPRVILAMLIGAALACSGAVFQVLLRNPLADPYILGISSGAGLGTILAVLAGLTWTAWGLSALSLFAFFGALGTTGLVWWIGQFTGRTSGTGLLLAGVVVNAFFSAFIMFLTSIARSDQIQTTVFWLMGYLKSYEQTKVLLVSGFFIAAAIAVLFRISPQLNILSLGPDQARSLGVLPERIFLIAFAAAALMTSVAVSLSGLVGFVGLIVPHTVRLLLGPDHRRLVPWCAIGGALFVAVADTVGRVVISQAQLPVGIITAMTGGPFFLVLLIRQSKQVFGDRL
jgi:iron complex transport system permease protein